MENTMKRKCSLFFEIEVQEVVLVLRLTAGVENARRTSKSLLYCSGFGLLLKFIMNPLDLNCILRALKSSLNLYNLEELFKNFSFLINSWGNTFQWQIDL